MHHCPQLSPTPRLSAAGCRQPDEFFSRPTAPADWWPDAPDILGGRDLQAGGSWLAMSRSGRVAALTNFRDPANLKPQSPSRGELVAGFLRSGKPHRRMPPACCHVWRTTTVSTCCCSTVANWSTCPAPNSGPTSCRRGCTWYRITCWIRRGPRWASWKQGLAAHPRIALWTRQRCLPCWQTATFRRIPACRTLASALSGERRLASVSSAPRLRHPCIDLCCDCSGSRSSLSSAALPTTGK